MPLAVQAGALLKKMATGPREGVDGQRGRTLKFVSVFYSAGTALPGAATVAGCLDSMNKKPATIR
jgi:hypothetical protein